MRLLRLLPIVFIALLVGAPMVSAQPKAAGKLWIRVFAAGPKIEGLYYKSEDGYKELDLLPFTSSPLIAVEQSGSPLKLYTKLVDPKSGVEHYVVSAEVDIPQDSNQVSILVSEVDAGEGGRTFESIVYDDSQDSFPVNSIRLINMSPNEVAVRFGDSIFRAKAGEAVAQPVTVDEKSRVFAVVGQLLSDDGYELRKFYQGPVSVPVGSRLTILAVYSLDGMRAHDYEVVRNSKGEEEIRYIVVKWLDRPLAR